MISDVTVTRNELYRAGISSSMEEYLRNIFEACDKDKDGYLDRSDLEEVRKQIGLEENITDILEQFGATETGKISYKQFCENSHLLLGGEHSSSESSPEYYSTDSETQSTPMDKDRGERTNMIRSRKEEDPPPKVEPSFKAKQATKELEEELKKSGDKIKKIAETFNLQNPHYNPHRKSGGGIVDYLDDKTRAHLEELNIIDPHSSCDKPYIDKPCTDDEEEETGTSSAGMRPNTKMRKADENFGDFGGPDYMEITKKLHLAAMTSYKNEIYELTSRLHQVRIERDDLRKQRSQWHLERQKMQQDFEDKLQSQTMRITELQSVIAELTRKLNTTNDNMIREEDEEDDMEEEDADDVMDDVRSHSSSDLENQGSRACSECSCDNCDCDQHLDAGPNQVNFLATTKDLAVDRSLTLPCVTPESTTTDPNNFSRRTQESAQTPSDTNENNDLQQQLHRVLGALESNIEQRKHNKTNDVAGGDGLFLDQTANIPSSQENTPSNPTVQLNDLQKQVENLKKEKRNLEKQLHEVMVQGYVYQKGNTGHVEEEFSKLRQDNNYLRQKLRKSEQELDEIKNENLTFREEKERMKKKTRAVQDAVVREPSPIHFIPDTNNKPSGHRRSNSTHVDRPHSPIVHQRSQSSAGEISRTNIPQRSHSLDSRSGHTSTHSPKLQQRSSSEVPRASPNNSMRSLPTSAFAAVNSKGYTVSPDNSLRRGQHFESSDLGSSIGDDSQRNILIQALVRNLRGHVPETLLQTLMAYNSLDPIFKLLVTHFVAEVDETRKEGVINVERLQSKMDHLQAQNDLTKLSLHESKQNAERLSLLCGKYESNSTAWSLALQNTEQLIETYEVMLQLQESEADMFAVNTNYPTVGNFDTIKSLTSTKSSQSNISIASSSSHIGFEDDEIIKTYHNKRKDLETQAKMLLHQLDKKYEYPRAHSNSTLANPTLANPTLANPNPVASVVEQDELSYKSRTSTGSSVNSVCTDTLSKDEENRLRDYIKRLKTERRTYQTTIVEKLESVHEYSDPPSSPQTAKEGSVNSERSDRTHDLNMDIETAVVIQDMQALKEERAELKHRIYLLEKEKRALELKLSSRDAQEQAYIVHIDHLKSEVKEQIKKRKQMLSRRPIMEDETLSINSGSTHSGPSEIQQYSSAEEIPADALEASRRERRLKHRIQELVDTLEKLSKNSENRNKETSEYISDLKRANGALVTAYEKAKKRHASRLKKFEQQLVTMAEKYQVQVRSLKEQNAKLKETQTKTQTETSL